MKRMALFAALGVVYSMLLFALGLFGIHESALFLGVALAPFWLGPLVWPVAFCLLAGDRLRAFRIVVGLHYLGVVFSLISARPYEWNPSAAGLLLAKGAIYVLSQAGVWILHARYAARGEMR